MIKVNIGWRSNINSLKCERQKKSFKNVYDLIEFCDRHFQNISNIEEMSTDFRKLSTFQKMVLREWYKDKES